jgi:hypothetical protein
MGLTDVLGELVAGVVEAGKKGEYFFQGYGVQLFVKKTGNSGIVCERSGPALVKP